MANVAELQIKVSATGVQPFAKSLESLGKAAQNYRADIKKVHTTLSEMGNVKLPTLGKGISQFKSLASATTGIKGATTSFTKLANAVDRMVSQSSGLSEVAKHLRSIKNSVTAMSGVRLNIGGATGGGASGSRGGMSDQEKLMRQISREGQMASVGYDKAAYLEQRAAMLGVSEAAKPYIAQMRAANKVVGVGVTNTRAYANAMRLVPAQLTDVVTQLAGGQNPFLIMIQQGGQLADVFRMAGVSMTGMIKAVGGTIARLLLAPLAAVGAVIGLVAYKLYDLDKTSTMFSKALASTNNITGQTVQSLKDMSYNAVGAGVSFGDAREAVSTFAASGVAANKGYSDLANTAVRFADVFGTDVNKVIADYITLNEKASERVFDLNKKYNFLTPSIYAQITALEKQGKQVEANALANEKLAETQNKMVAEAKKDMGILSSVWDSVTKSISGAASAVWNFRFAQTNAERLTKINADIVSQQEYLVKLQERGRAADKGKIADIQQNLKDLNATKATIEATERVKQESDARTQKDVELNQKNLEILKWINKSTDQSLSKESVLLNFQKQKSVWIKEHGEAAAKNVNWAALEKKYLEEQFPASTRLSKESDKRTEAERERQQRQAGIVASLKEQLKDGEARLADLRGEDVEYTKINEHLSKAASLRAQADKEKNSAAKEDMLIQASLEQQVGEQLQLIWKIVQAEKERSKLSDQQNTAAEIRKRYAETETGQLKEQESQDLKKIANLDKMTAAEKAQLELIVKQGSARKQAEQFVSDLGNPIANEEMRHNKRMQWIEQNKIALQQLGVYESTIAEANFAKEQNMFNAKKQWFMAQSQWNTTLMTTMDAVGSSLSSSLAGVIKGTTSLKEMFNSLGDAILNSVVGALVQMGVQWVQNLILGQSVAAVNASMLTTAVAAQVEMMSVIAAQNAFAATSAIPFVGPALAPAAATAAGVAAQTIGSPAIALAPAAGAKPMMDNGGIIQPGQSVVAGEYGREIITAGSSPVRVTSRKETERMMGQSSGSGGTQVNMQVINNAGVDVQQTTDPEGNIVLVLEKYLPNMLAREGSNPKSKLNQAQSSIYAQKRR